MILIILNIRKIKADHRSLIDSIRNLSFIDISALVYCQADACRQLVLRVDQPMVVAEFVAGAAAYHYICDYC